MNGIAALSIILALFLPILALYALTERYCPHVYDWAIRKMGVDPYAQRPSGYEKRQKKMPYQAR